MLKDMEQRRIRPLQFVMLVRGKMSLTRYRDIRREFLKLDSNWHILYLLILVALAGFYWFIFLTSGVWTWRLFVVPMLMSLLVGFEMFFGMGPVSKENSRQVFSRRQRCPKCYYDLSRTDPSTTDGKLCCPECGIRFLWDDVG